MILQVRVKANSKFNKIEKDLAGNWILKIKAPPVDGKANNELIKFIAEKLSISKSSIKILSGHSSKIKRISIEGVEIAQAEEKFCK